jgi:hypothetical protein
MVRVYRSENLFLVEEQSAIAAVMGYGIVTHDNRRKVDQTIPRGLNPCPFKTVPLSASCLDLWKWPKVL